MRIFDRNLRVPKAGAIAGVMMAMTAFCSAQISIRGCSTTSKIKAIGGGGGTPVSRCPKKIDLYNPSGIDFTNSAFASGPALDGSGNLRGKGKGSAATGANVEIDNLGGITGSGGTSASFLTTGSAATGLGNGLGDAAMLVTVVFEVATAQDFTYVAEIDGDTSGVDWVKLLRRNGGFAPTLLYFATGANDVNATGTFIPGIYEIEVRLSTGVAGGIAQGGDSESNTYSFDLDFTNDPVLTGNDLPDFEELSIRSFSPGEDGEKELTFDAEAGVGYVITTTVDLNSPWERVEETEFEAGSAGQYTVVIPDFEDSKRFFRVEKISPES